MTRRQTIGQLLQQAREQAGLSVPQLVQRIREVHDKDIGASTIRDIEKDKTPNPGVKTLEFISLGVGLDPLEVISLGLDNSPELEPGFTESQFAQLGRTYKKVPKDKRPFADEFIRMLIQTMERWR
jgi:transcriptional regulator with XRE-family HTH domain